MKLVDGVRDLIDQNLFAEASAHLERIKHLLTKDENAELALAISKALLSGVKRPRGRHIVLDGFAVMCKEAWAAECVQDLKDLDGRNLYSAYATVGERRDINQSESWVRDAYKKWRRPVKTP